MLNYNSQNKKAPQMIHNMFRTAGAVALSLLVVGSPIAVPFSYAANAPTQNITLYPLDANTRSIVSYSDQACTKPTGKVYGTDKCKILEVLDQSIKLQYPTSKGTRTAYVKLSDFVKGNFSSADKKTMENNQTVFAYQTGNKKLGTVYKDDIVYILYAGSNRYQIIYPLDVGGWKCGWIDRENSSKASDNNSTNSSGAKKDTITETLYQINTDKSSIICKFDGYGSGRKGSRHEGIDFMLGKGKPIHSLVNGTVTRVNKSSSLSTIAIYDSSHDLTFVVLHAKPLSSLSAGDKVSIGQQIGTEDGFGAGATPHTHIEMRPGRCKYAAKSIDDPKLDNPNPAPYYQKLGYKVW